MQWPSCDLSLLLPVIGRRENRRQDQPGGQHHDGTPTHHTDRGVPRRGGRPRPRPRLLLRNLHLRLAVLAMLHRLTLVAFAGRIGHHHIGLPIAEGPHGKNPSGRIYVILRRLAVCPGKHLDDSIAFFHCSANNGFTRGSAFFVRGRANSRVLLRCGLVTRSFICGLCQGICWRLTFCAIICNSFCTSVLWCALIFPVL